MFELTLNNIIDLLMQHRYLLLFPIAIIEGPIVSIIGGFLIHKGIFSTIPVYLILFSGDLIGDLMYYAVGRFGGRRFITRFGKYIGIELTDLEAFKQKFHSHSKKILLFGKFSQIGGMPSLISAGLSKMNVSHFIVINAIGSGIKIIILIIVGYYFGLAYEKIDHYLGSTFRIGTIIVLVILFLWYAYFLIKKKRAS